MTPAGSAPASAPVCGHPEDAHTLTAYWECTACGGRCWAPEPPDEWYRDPDTGEQYQAWERSLWELDALPAAARRGLIRQVRAEIARWTQP